MNEYIRSLSKCPVILSPDYCMKTVINHTSSSPPFICLCCLSSRIVFSRPY